MSKTVTIIDYGMGNLRSVQKAFERINVSANITNNPLDLTKANKIILPGVGHFQQGMKNLSETGFSDAIREEIIKDKPILGICLGMQLLTSFSEEGNVYGLGVVLGKTLKFPFSKLKIPHMGWNSLNIIKETNLSNSISKDDLFYFAHSYYVKCSNITDVLFQTEYGITFDSWFQHGKIFGVQFHPEKSHKSGLSILSNFISL